MTGPLTIKCDFHPGSQRTSHKRMKEGPAPEPKPVGLGRVPRVTRLMALAIRFDRLIEEERLEDYAQIARLGHVTRARMTQIMNLRLLAPDIQEDILFLPRVYQGRDPITEKDLRPIAAEQDWATQRRMWRDRRGRGTGT